MFPAICRGRALDSCLLAAVFVLSACASTGPGSPPSLSTGAAPAPPPVAGAPSTTASAAVSPKRRTAPAKPRRVPMDSAALEREITRRLAHQPLAIALARRARYPQLADRIAAAVVYEAGRARISPSVLAAVLLIENAPMDTGAVSTEGAIGLMQVMPMHVGNYRCLSGDLLNVEANICHGARLLHNHIRRAKSIELALRRYNGCVRGRNTPRCQRYPGRVLRTAARLRREILVTGAKLQGDGAAGGLNSSRLGALPPDLEGDLGAGAASVQAKCDSFLGCLKDRWSR
jgi:soluble lytic murein transglycosylase-like protein